jgi:hypothetical protein
MGLRSTLHLQAKSLGFIRQALNQDPHAAYLNLQFDWRMCLCNFLYMQK